MSDSKGLVRHENAIFKIHRVGKVLAHLAHRAILPIVYMNAYIAQIPTICLLSSSLSFVYFALSLSIPLHLLGVIYSGTRPSRPSKIARITSTKIAFLAQFSRFRLRYLVIFCGGKLFQLDFLKRENTLLRCNKGKITSLLLRSFQTFSFLPFASFVAKLRT